MNEKVNVLQEAVLCLQNENYILAKKILSEKYPFSPVVKNKRKYTAKQMIEQFFRDGFIDRYSGEKLINPGMLRVLSELFPFEFPYQSHWNTNECHIAYWDFQPTIDHIYPISLGGKDEIDNWVSTSMINNSIKGNFTLEQLGWQLKEKGNLKEWDGLSEKFIQIVNKNRELLENKSIYKWYNVTQKTFLKINENETI